MSIQGSVNQLLTLGVGLHALGVHEASQRYAGAKQAYATYRENAVRRHPEIANIMASYGELQSVKEGLNPPKGIRGYNKATKDIGKYIGEVKGIVKGLERPEPAHDYGPDNYTPEMDENDVQGMKARQAAQQAINNAHAQKEVTKQRKTSPREKGRMKAGDK